MSNEVLVVEMAVVKVVRELRSRAECIYFFRAVFVIETYDCCSFLLRLIC